jgi:aerobic carbon-monoxide dehydrogenase large subunit
MTSAMSGGVGARITRNEDRRHLRGQGSFVADLRLAGQREVSFVRSPFAHGVLRSVTVPAAPAKAVWTADDLAAIARPIVADSGHPGFKSSDQPILATGKVRYVGEPVALVIADTRADAEDLAARVELDVEPVPAVVDPAAALDPEAAVVHDHWGDNCVIVREGGGGDLDTAAKQAAITIERHYRMARHAAVPLETRGCVAWYDTRVDQLVLWSSTQFPHVIRTMLSELLGLEERRLRVIAPDVGGGFGVKNNLYPEEVAMCAVAMQVGHPIRWIEDRWENLVAAAQARDHTYRIVAHAAADGDLLGVDAELLIDAGAYSVWPWTSAMEAGMSSGIIPGPYRLRNYRFRAVTVATNKAPLGPYRGVARPGACFAIERTIDEVAIALGLEPKDVRMRNMIASDEFPYTSVTGMVYDSGRYADQVAAAAERIGHDAVRAEQAATPTDATVRVGVGYASYTEQTAHGAEEWVRRKLPVVFGFETATATLDPSGTLTVDVGIQSHGQGLETTLAQVAADVLGVDPHGVTVRHGDTGISPYGMGTFASRSMVMAGGAVHLACSDLAAKVREVAGALLSCPPDELTLAEAKVSGPRGSVTLADVAEAAYLHVERIPVSIEPGLTVTRHYRPEISTGAFASSTHAVKVAVDVDTGEVSLLDYVVAEDCGRVVNPLIADGQVHGGVAQGIGTALYEETPYNADGQPTATTFMDYLLPGATEVPDVTVLHQETLSPHTILGIKGMGEGGAIAPPAAIANAVTDALRPYGAHANVTPLTPAAVWACLDEARQGRQP